jgi:predicted permease
MDPDQQHAANILAGMSLGIVLFGFLVIFAFLALWVFLYWRIFTKAGLSGALSLIILFPFFGYLIVLCFLAFSEWKVIPAPMAYPGLQPYPPPPPPSYPPPPPQV